MNKDKRRKVETHYRADRDPVKTNTINLNTHGVPKRLHQRFKAKCAKEGFTMKESIINLIREYVS